MEETPRRVPNQRPFFDSTSRIAIIGEAPGEEEEAHRVPFVGTSGQLLDRVLYAVGIDRRACLIGNICQVRPPSNNLSAFDWDGPEIQEGIAQLTLDLNEFKPNICLLLGNTPLKVALGDHKKITDWRGSLFIGDHYGPFDSRKCIPSLHPAYVARDYSGHPLLRFDCKRAREESYSPSLVLPQRTLHTDLPAQELVRYMDEWPSGQRCSVDIEGVIGHWTCVSLASSPLYSVCIVWDHFSLTDHALVLQSFARLMYREDVPKVLQNQLYDNFVLSYGYGIPIRGVAEDTLIKGWCIYAEIPRSLSTQASIWTRQPHWKDERMYSGGNPLYQGCAMDSAVTLEICTAQDSVLKGAQLAHYRKTIELQTPFLYMELRGIKYDTSQAQEELAPVAHELQLLGDKLSNIAGHDLRGLKGSLSPKKLSDLLYKQQGYPEQFRKEDHKLTTDAEAILNLQKLRPLDGLLAGILKHRHLEGVRETLSITADEDGRVRCGYSLEAETGRVRCYTSPTGSGANLQTIQKALRHLYVADEGYDFFQCDLEGADGWTVAAYSLKLGDSTMWDDYKAGMKPAKLIALMYWLGPQVNSFDREELKWLHDNVFPIVHKLAGEWLYLGCKRVQHGSSYGMGPPTMCLNILRDSFKESGTPIYMEQRVAKQLQQLFFTRYPGVQSWQRWCETKLKAEGSLTTASGQKRLFFGRRFGENNDTYKKFLAHAPQSNTTWVTNSAALNLWNDPQNRREDGSLIIEPLHQVHDALCGQWPTPVRSWARGKLKEYFNITLNIEGIQVQIPFDGAYGTSWGNLPHKI
jgi:uracil-DNA glycosylase family 4